MNTNRFDFEFTFIRDGYLYSTQDGLRFARHLVDCKSAYSIGLGNCSCNSHEPIQYVETEAATHELQAACLRAIQDYSRPELWAGIVKNIPV